MSSFIKLQSAVGGLVGLTFLASAKASLILTVNGVPVVDNGPSDLNPAIGSILYITPVPGYTVQSQIATSNSGTGASSGVISLNTSVTRDATGSVTPLTVNISDNGFTGGVGTEQLTSSAAETLTAHDSTSSVSFTGSCDTATTTPVVLSVNNTNTSRTQTVPYTVNGSYGLSGAAVFNLGPSDTATLNAVVTTAVPEPASLALGATGVLLLVRRRSQ